MRHDASCCVENAAEITPVLISALRDARQRALTCVGEYEQALTQTMRLSVDSGGILLSEVNENCLTYKERIEVRADCITEKQCLDAGWNLTGSACYDPHITRAVPDVFLLSIMLFIGTFSLAMTFRMFRTSRFFPTIVRTFTQRRSAPQSIGCFRRHLFVCLFVCQHDNFRTSKHMIMRLGGVGALYKNIDQVRILGS